MGAFRPSKVVSQATLGTSTLFWILAAPRTVLVFAAPREVVDDVDVSVQGRLPG